MDRTEWDFNRLLYCNDKSPKKQILIIRTNGGVIFLWLTGLILQINVVGVLHFHIPLFSK